MLYQLGYRPKTWYLQPPVPCPTADSFLPWPMPLWGCWAVRARWAYGEEVARDIWTSNIHLNAEATVFLLEDASNISSFLFLMKSLGFLLLLRAEASHCKVGLRVSGCWGTYEGLWMATPQWPCGQALALSLLGNTIHFTVQKSGALLTPLRHGRKSLLVSVSFQPHFLGFSLPPRRLVSSHYRQCVLQTVHLGQRWPVLSYNSSICGAFNGLLANVLIWPAAKHVAILSELLYALCQPLRNQAFLSISKTDLLACCPKPTHKTDCLLGASRG